MSPSPIDSSLSTTSFPLKGKDGMRVGSFERDRVAPSDCECIANAGCDDGFEGWKYDKN